jgi:hypothetical protein
VAADGEEATVQSERGWGKILPALLLFLFLPLIPLGRVLLPVEQTLLLLIPAMGACAVVGWKSGGRLLLAVAWTGLAVWVLMNRGTGTGAYDTMARGWAVLVAASFAIVSIAGMRQRFFGRALAAILLAFVVAGAVVLFADGGGAVQRTMANELGRRGDAWLAALDQATQTPGWQSVVQRYPSLSALHSGVERQLQQLTEQSKLLFPALLGLESLAALSLAWGLYHRVSRHRIGVPLLALREFRFNDQLIWGLVVGAILAVIPSFAVLRGFGLNLLVFFGAIYALRGLGVLTWFLAPRRVALVLLVIVGFLSWQILGVFSFGLGVGDTWLDWRGRARPST